MHPKLIGFDFINQDQVIIWSSNSRNLRYLWVNVKEMYCLVEGNALHNLIKLTNAFIQIVKGYDNNNQSTIVLLPT
jgi:hypothetical protein